MSLIPELLDPKAQEHIRWKHKLTPSSLVPKPGLFLAVSPLQVLSLLRSLPSCLQGITTRRPMGLEDTSF